MHTGCFYRLKVAEDSNVISRYLNLENEMLPSIETKDSLDFNLHAVINQALLCVFNPYVPSNVNSISAAYRHHENTK